MVQKSCAGTLKLNARTLNGYDTKKPEGTTCVTVQVPSAAMAMDIDPQERPPRGRLGRGGDMALQYVGTHGKGKKGKGKGKGKSIGKGAGTNGPRQERHQRRLQGLVRAFGVRRSGTKRARARRSGNGMAWQARERQWDSERKPARC